MAIVWILFALVIVLLILILYIFWHELPTIHAHTIREGIPINTTPVFEPMQDFTENPITRPFFDTIMEQFMQIPWQNNNQTAAAFVLFREPKQPEIHERGEKFFEKIQKINHNNDPQNVHDTLVVNGITKIYKRLEELNERDFPGGGGEMKNQTILEVNAEINKFAAKYLQKKAKNDEEFREMGEKIDFMLETINNGNKISCVNEKENWILCQLWRRSNSQENGEKGEQIKEALIDGLLDCVKSPILSFVPLIRGDDKYSSECPQGRIARMISSLTLIDVDPVLSSPIMDEKEMENVIYLKASSILKRELMNYDGGKIENIYTADEDTLSDDSKEKIKKFESHVRDCMQKELTEEYKNILDFEKLNNIIKKAQAGI